MLLAGGNTDGDGQRRRRLRDVSSNLSEADREVLAEAIETFGPWIKRFSRTPEGEEWRSAFQEIRRQMTRSVEPPAEPPQPPGS